MISRIVLISLLVLVLGAGCTAGENSRAGRTSVVAAFYPLAFAASRIGGGSVSVDNLTASGAEPHDLELTPRTVADIQSADVVLYLGHGFQPAVSDAVTGARGRLVDALDGMPLRQPSGDVDAGLTADPHVWLDPQLYARIARRFGRVLHRPARAARLVAKLDALDHAYRAGLAHCSRNEIVTSHAAFGYLARRYGLRQVAITGVTPESEPTARDLAHVVDVVRRTHSTTVFFETLLSPRLAETVAREVGAKTAVLDPLEGLNPKETARGATYFTVMRSNLAALRRALACR